MNIQFKEAECYKIDAEKKKIYCRTTEDRTCGGKEEFALDYDILVIAMGAQVNTFNTPGVVEHAHFLKVLSQLHFDCLNCFITLTITCSQGLKRKKSVLNRLFKKKNCLSRVYLEGISSDFPIQKYLCIKGFFVFL